MLKRLLRGLASMRTAIVLLCLVACGHVAGTFIMQNPAEHTAVAAYGVFWHRLFEALGLYHAAQAWWLLVLQGGLAVSVACCLWRQLPGRFRPMLAGRLPTLRHVGYAALHLGVLLLAVAGLVEGLFSWKGQLNLRMGETDAVVLQTKRGEFVPKKLPFAVTAESFNIMRHNNGAPKSFETTLTIAGVSHTLSVNKPLAVPAEGLGGYRLYQADYGDAGSVVTLAFNAPTEGEAGVSSAQPLKSASGKPSEDTAQEVTDKTWVQRVYDTFSHGDYRYILTDAPTHVRLLGKNVGQGVNFTVLPPAEAPFAVQLYAKAPQWVGLSEEAPVGAETVFYPVPRQSLAHPLPTVVAVEKAYYTGLLVAYSPAPWLFWLAAFVLLVGVWALALGKPAMRGPQSV